MCKGFFEFARIQLLHLLVVGGVLGIWLCYGDDGSESSFEISGPQGGAVADPKVVSLARIYEAQLKTLQDTYLAKGRKNAWLEAEREIEYCRKNPESIPSMPAPVVAMEVVELRRQYARALERTTAPSVTRPPAIAGPVPSRGGNERRKAEDGRQVQKEVPAKKDEVRSASSLGIVTVTSRTGGPIVGARVFYIDRRKSICVASGQTDKNGEVKLLPQSRDSVTVFCAHPDYSAYKKKSHSPPEPLTIEMGERAGCGSIVCDRTCYVPGLAGRLNPILDSHGRLYMYADNVALEGGKEQPVDFALGRRIKAEDQNGIRFDLTVVDFLGDFSLIEYRRK